MANVWDHLPCTEPWVRRGKRGGHMEHMEPRFGPPYGVTFWELCPQVKAVMTDRRMICTFTPTDTDSPNAHPPSLVSLSLFHLFCSSGWEKKHIFLLNKQQLRARWTSRGSNAKPYQWTKTLFQGSAWQRGGNMMIRVWNRLLWGSIHSFLNQIWVTSNKSTNKRRGCSLLSVLLSQPADSNPQQAVEPFKQHSLLIILPVCSFWLQTSTDLRAGG